MTNGSFVVPVPRARGKLKVLPPNPTTEIPFPRRWQYRIGFRDYAQDDAVGETERNRMALLNGVFLGMYPDGPWDRGSTGFLQRAEIVADLKSRNPDLLMGDYINVMETGLTGEMGTYAQGQTGPLGNGGSWFPNDWIARDTSGVPVGTFSSSVNTNITDNVELDQFGRDYVDAYYQIRVRDQILAAHEGPGGLGVGPEGMGLFLDNVFARMRTNSPDLDRNGSSDGGRSDRFAPQATKWREGTMKLLDLIYQDFPNCLVFGNVTEWFDESISPTQMMPEYIGRWIGGAVENGVTNFPYCGIDRDGTILPFGNGELAFAAYTYAMDNCTNEYVSNAWAFDISNLENPGPGTYFKGHRFAMTQTSLDNGFVHLENNVNYSSTPPFDEYGEINQITTGLQPGWLGQAIDPPQRTPIKASLYFRRFDNGAVLHNMNRTQAVTVGVGSDIPSGYSRIPGLQDPSVNDGSFLTTFDLPGGDGLFLRI